MLVRRDHPRADDLRSRIVDLLARPGVLGSVDVPGHVHEREAVRRDPEPSAPAAGPATKTSAPRSATTSAGAPTGQAAKMSCRGFRELDDAARAAAVTSLGVKDNAEQVAMVVAVTCLSDPTTRSPTSSMNWWPDANTFSSMMNRPWTVLHGPLFSRSRPLDREHAAPRITAPTSTATS